MMTDIENELEAIAVMLQTRREQLGMSQKELAERAGLGIATVKRFESGRAFINMRQYAALCTVLKMQYYPLHLKI